MDSHFPPNRLSSEEEVYQLASQLSTSAEREKASSSKLDEKRKEIEDYVFRMEEMEIKVCKVLRGQGETGDLIYILLLAGKL